MSRIVVFGLSVTSSSWGNDHATCYRGLLAALGDHGAATLLCELQRHRCHTSVGPG